MRFTKMHGASNDYIYIDARNDEKDWPALSVAMSDRHTGVGADGIILVLQSEGADLRMKMFNSDGSEGEMCGNGIRCFASYAIGRDIVPADTQSLSVETPAGIIWVTPVWNGGRITAAKVDMGPPTLNPKIIPALAPGHETIIDYPLRVEGHNFNITCVSMGNPHAVAFVEQPVDELPLGDIGPMVELHPMFPNKINFEVVNLVDRGSLRARVWERGSGLTMACGTGACAIGVAARMLDYVDDDVSISLPGGDLNVRWPGYGSVILEGPVEEVFSGEWPEEEAS